MKGLIIGLGAVLVLIIGGLFALNATEYDLYEEGNQEVVKDMFKEDGGNVYYFYQPTCSYCTTVKPEVTKFAQEVEGTDVKFNLIDMSKEENKELWATQEESNDYQVEQKTKNIDKMKSYDDVVVYGTPQMIYIKDDKVVKQGIGSEVFDVMDEALKTIDSDLELNKEIYYQ